MANYVIRNLNELEDPSLGLVASAPDDTRCSLERHVANGKIDSRWISATRSLSVALEYNEKNETGKRSRMVLIDIEKSGQMPFNCAHRGDWAKTAYNFGTASQEVAFEKFIPTDAIETFLDYKDLELFSKSISDEDKTALSKLSEIYKEAYNESFTIDCQGMDNFIRVNQFQPPKINCGIDIKSEKENCQNISTRMFYLLDKVSPVLLEKGDIDTLKAGTVAIGKYIKELQKTWQKDLHVDLSPPFALKIVEIPDERYKNIEQKNIPKNGYRLAIDTDTAKHSFDESEYKSIHQPDKYPALIASQKKTAEQYFSKEKNAPITDNIAALKNGITAVKGNTLYMQLLASKFGGEIYGENNKWIGHADFTQVKSFLSEALNVENALNDASERLALEDSTKALEACIEAEEKYNKIFSDEVRHYELRSKTMDLER